jgi:hypothetical protein
MLRRKLPVRLAAGRRDSIETAGDGTDFAEPERLVGLGFRYWMLGRQTGDIGCWERTWNLYSGVFGLCGARLAVGTLSCWVGTLGGAAHRRIEVGSIGCPQFCRDECLAVSMIAACQTNTCPAMRACAFALVETSMIDRVVGEAQAFADTMSGLEQRLSPASIVNAPFPAQRAGRLVH